MISVSVSYRVKSEFSELFLKRMADHAKTTFWKEDGCVFFDYCRSSDSDDKFFVYEIYKSIEDLDTHKSSRHAACFANDVKDWLLQRCVSVWERVGTGA